MNTDQTTPLGAASGSILFAIQATCEHKRTRRAVDKSWLAGKGLGATYTLQQTTFSGASFRKQIFPMLIGESFQDKS